MTDKKFYFQILNPFMINLFNRSLISFEVKYSENFFLLRGNHECSVINRVYGFFEECNRRYQSVRLWQTFQVL